MGWHPIETAPKDGTVIDLWMEDSRFGGHRVADAYWNPSGIRRTWKDGKWQDIADACWYAPNFERDFQDGCCETRRVAVDSERWGKWIWDEATHWRPVPAPPTK